MYLNVFIHLVGRNLFPATGYLFLVLETVAYAGDYLTDDVRVIMEDVRFLRATTITPESITRLTITVQEITGLFEVSNVALLFLIPPNEIFVTFIA